METANIAYLITGGGVLVTESVIFTKVGTFTGNYALNWAMICWWLNLGHHLTRNCWVTVLAVME